MTGVCKTGSLEVVMRVGKPVHLDVDHHLFVDVRVADDLAELLEVDLAVVVLVREEDRLVDDLLELRVLQVGAHHHLQHLEELAVADVPVIVNVVDPERDLGSVD